MAEAFSHTVGTGCPLLRRESQWPGVGVSTRHAARWTALRASLYDLTRTDGPGIARIAANSSVADKAHPWFERQNVPVLLEGLADHWPARHTMTWEALRHNFGHFAWRVSDTHAETLSLHTFTKYVTTGDGQVDDAPLALYDSQFHLDERASLVNDYTVPKCFAQDLCYLKLELVSEINLFNLFVVQNVIRRS